MNILYYFLGVIDTIVVYMFLSCYFARRHWVRTIHVMLIILSIVIPGILIKDNINTMEINFLITMMIDISIGVIFFEGKMLRKVALSAFYLLIVICIDFIIGVLLHFIVGVWPGDIIRSLYLKTTAYSICVALEFIFVQLIIILHRKKSLKDGGYWHLTQLLIPVISVLGLLFLNTAEVRRDEPHYPSMLITSILLLIINIGQYLLFQRVGELQYQNFRNSQLADAYKYRDSHYAEIEKHQNDIRTIKHDLKNQLYSIKSSLEQGADAEAQAAVKAVLDDVLITEEHLFTSNYAVNALLCAKYAVAAGHKITCSFDIMMPDQLNISERDLLVLLGNLLDNCIEAAEKTRDAQIELRIACHGGAIAIHTCNTTDGNVRDLTTRKNEHLNHGLGLPSIRSIAEKYRGSAAFKIKGNAFIADILLWNIE